MKPYNYKFCTKHHTYYPDVTECPDCDARFGNIMCKVWLVFFILIILTIIGAALEKYWGIKLW